MDFYRAYLQNLVPDENRLRYSFLLGYFFHLLCDSLWAKWIGKATKRDFGSFIDKMGIKAFDEIKGDWYGLDQIFVRDHPQTIFWRQFLPAANPPSYLPFLPEAAMHHQLDYIRNFYSKPDPKCGLGRPFPYLNEETMTRYVNDSVGVVLNIYGRLAQLSELNDSHTALSLIPTEKLQPYESPLGDEIV
jgi:hypothetical protein